MTKSEWPSDLPAAAHQAQRLLLRELKGDVVRSTAEDGMAKQSPVTKWVRKLEKDYGERYYLASEVAAELGVSVQAIRKYAKKQVCGPGVAPSRAVPFGDIEINLYTVDDLKALQAYLDTRNVIYKISEKGGE